MLHHRLARAVVADVDLGAVAAVQTGRIEGVEPLAIVENAMGDELHDGSRRVLALCHAQHG
jgi:hypothetical protein